jgi:Na+/H+-dicarboxylate symporter
MSTTTVIIALLSIIVGYIGQAVRTGSLFGLVNIPPKIVPVLTLVGTFLAAGVTSVSQATTVNSAAWITALLAGLTSLTGSTVGITIHQHVMASKPSNKASAEVKIEVKAS